MHDSLLNIAGTEWVIIIFVGLILILGTGKLPGAARKIGKVVNEYNRAKDEIQEHVGAVQNSMNGMPEISGPVETEREKLETIARSVGIGDDVKNIDDDDLRNIIAKKTGRVGDVPAAGNKTGTSE